MPLDAEPPDNRPVQRDKNLDVVGTSRDQKSLEPKAPAGESAADRSYLLCALSRHSPIANESTVGAIDVVAAKIFRSPKPPTSSRRSTLQNRSVSPWLPTSPFTGRAPTPGMIPMARALRKFGRA